MTAPVLSSTQGTILREILAAGGRKVITGSMRAGDISACRVLVRRHLLTNAGGGLYVLTLKGRQQAHSSQARVDAEQVTP